MEEKDIVPELLESIKKEFNRKYKASDLIKKKLEKLKSSNLDYDDAYDYADEVGKILVEVYKKHVTSEVLPDGKMYYNIAERLLNDTLGSNHELVAEYAQIVQTLVNKNAGYDIQAIKSQINPDRIKGFIERLVHEETFEDIDWILGEPVMTYTRGVVDDTVEINAEFNNDLGIKGVIERTERYDACSWCKNLEGVYNYPHDVPDEIFMRHENCKGRVIYRPLNKRKVQDVHSREWVRR